MSRSNGKGQGHQGQKRAVYSHYPPAVEEWSHLLHDVILLRARFGGLHYQ